MPREVALMSEGRGEGGVGEGNTMGRRCPCGGKMTISLCGGRNHKTCAPVEWTRSGELKRTCGEIWGRALSLERRAIYPSSGTNPNPTGAEDDPP